MEGHQDELAYSETPLAASIAEGLADIYQDVRDLLEIYRIGNEELSQAAISRCRSNFVTYWGQKLVNVMRPLHALTFAPGESDEDDYETPLHDCDDDDCHCHH